MSQETRPVIEPERCFGCRACEQVCPQGCIDVRPDARGFEYPAIRTEDCTDCGLCRRHCPALRDGRHDGEPDVFAVVSNDNKELAQSSSGGVFSLLARQCLARGGVVFGAAFDEAMTVRHRAAHTIEELAALRGSKYVQSDTGGSYTQAKALLEADVPVLYTGVSCQVAGLLAFLGRDYENLLAVELLCMGVPSPGVWRAHVAHTERKHGSAVVGMNFRDKRLGWAATPVYKLADGRELVVRDPVYDPFMVGFMRRLTLRDCCSDCPYGSPQRAGDITLGDFWGIEAFRNDIDSRMGVSLAICSTPKGRAALDAIEDTAKLYPETLAHAQAKNPRLNPGGSPASRNNRAFFADFTLKTYAETARLHLRPGVAGLLRRLPRPVETVIRRLLRRG